MIALGRFCQGSSVILSGRHFCNLLEHTRNLRTKSEELECQAKSCHKHVAINPPQKK